MDIKVSIIKSVLEQIGMPKAQQADLCALTIFSMANIKPHDRWSTVQAEWIRINDIIAFSNVYYIQHYPTLISLKTYL